MLFTSCNFFSQKDPVKEKANALFEKITIQKNELEPRVNALTSFKKKPTTSDEVVDVDIDSDTLGHPIKDFYEFWMTAYDKFDKQSVYMNYDLQVIRLEALEETLNKIKEMVEESEKMNN